MSLRARWQAAAGLIATNRDVLDARPGDPRWAVDGADDGLTGPAALASRGWTSFLLSLEDERLEAIEALGTEADWHDAPESLASLVDGVRTVSTLRWLVLGPASRPARRLETPRKRAQIDAFAEVVIALAARSRRVVDVGSGHGHLTREIAERIELPVVGLERDASLARRAEELPSAGAPEFAVTDVLKDGLGIGSGDCVIGLHACGELGDAMAEGVAAVDGPTSIALVGCCLQKRRSASRRPLASAANPSESWGALHLPRPLLGLSNLTARDDGVEATRAENVAGRQRRLALHKLLSRRLGPLRLGEEIDGLNRRAAQGDLPGLVVRAFAHRGLLAPGPTEIEDAAVWARAEHARRRRLSLPRALLARVLEVFVLVDRATFLEERGFTVSVGSVFGIEVSARNLGLVGTR